MGAGLHLSQEGKAFFEESPKEVIDEVWQLIDQHLRRCDIQSN